MGVVNEKRIKSKKEDVYKKITFFPSFIEKVIDSHFLNIIHFFSRSLYIDIGTLKFKTLTILYGGKTCNT